MPKNEGEILKNKLKGTGKKAAEIAAILGMSRQNVNYHLAKEKLDDDFRRLVKEKSQAIFQTENVFEDEENLNKIISSLKEDILKLKAAEKIQGMWIAELYSVANKISNTDAALKLEDSVQKESDKLFSLLNKKQ